MITWLIMGFFGFCGSVPDQIKTCPEYFIKRNY
jgi:hypothetical protein